MRVLTLNLDAERVTAWAKSVSIPRHDVGYLAHAFMRRFFEDAAPQPFLAVKEEGCLIVEGVLSENVEPEVFEGSHDVMDCGVKDVTLPQSGDVAAFRVRLCPVMRNGSSGKEIETDAFLVMLRRAEAAGQTPPKRMQVYREWVAGRFADCMDLGNVYIKSYESVRPCRRGAPGHVGAAAAIGWRPVIDAFVKGKVIDAERFSCLLRKGIGRHKAFGFGYIRMGDYHETR